MSMILVMTDTGNSHVNKQLNKINDLKSRSGIAQELGGRNAFSAGVVHCGRSVCDIVDLIVIVADGQRRATMVSKASACSLEV